MLSGLSLVTPLVGVLVAGVLGYFSGRLLETRKQLILQKGQAYADYLRALATAATDHKSTISMALAADAKTRICVYGSAGVLRQLSAFEQIGAKIESADARRIIAHLLKAMRDDVGVSRRRIEETHLHYVLFGPDR